MIHIPSIKIINPDSEEAKNAKTRLADCVVLTHDNKVLLQYRPKGWSNEFGMNLFGGHVEQHETIIEGLCREIKEELGAPITPDDVQFIGAISEDWTNHKEFVHLYFWHDTDNKITGCYEAEAREFNNVENATAQPKLMDYAKWALLKCQELKLLD